ncbi:hypothetical protein NEOLI_002459 [Neolecta irregularis DAH-3]|uniref:Uncharacterized protein n=1 Tax=Neolecta irregularis (strain DAH-3) TaxID=1198029 RepID=A0A1U7LVR4_NEOID|nr:hypothetical protein NEOLI_002459 [Neolecta irregularis DAH-3]|eukprot:OLL26663.1 hypothetical protein NEOLI_002459 [Neolecta irregularis DAH-3]
MNFLLISFLAILVSSTKLQQCIDNGKNSLHIVNTYLSNPRVTDEQLRNVVCDQLKLDMLTCAKGLRENPNTVAAQYLGKLAITGPEALPSYVSAACNLPMLFVREFLKINEIVKTARETKEKVCGDDIIKEQISRSLIGTEIAQDKLSEIIEHFCNS